MKSTGRTLGVDLDGTIIRSVAMRRGRIEKAWSVQHYEPLDCQGGQIISALPEPLIRSVILPKVKRRERKALLPFQIEGILPFSIEESIVEGESIDDEGLLYSVAVSRKRDLEAHLEQLKGCSITPERVSTVPHALAAFLAAIFPGEKGPKTILHIGHQWSAMVVCQQGRVLAARVFLTGEESSLPQEAHKTLCALRSEREIETVFLSGRGPLFESFLASEIDVPLQRLPSDHPYAEACEIDRFAVAIGLALRPNLNLYREAPFPWRRQRWQVGNYFAASVLIGAALWFCGEGLERRAPKKALYAARHHLQQLQAGPHWFPLKPSVPLVSEVLNWLNDHPMTSDLKMEKIRYVLNKRPSLTKKGEPYLAQIELEFIAPKASAARRFHEALMEKNAMVDPRKEVRWSQAGDTYRVAFTLRGGR